MELRYVVAQFCAEQEALVSDPLAGGVSTHAASTAERHFLGGGEVLVGKLPAKGNEKVYILGDQLQAPHVKVGLRELALCLQTGHTLVGGGQ